MKLNEDAKWYLSAMELTLCLRILGRKAGTAVPVEKTGQPLEHRMLGDFVHLAELGLLEPSGTGYVPSETLRNRLMPAAQPERIAILPDADRPLAVYIRGNEAAVIETCGEDGQTCAVEAIRAADAAALIAGKLRAEIEKRPSLQILNGDGTPVDRVRFGGDGTESPELLYIETVLGLVNGDGKGKGKDK